MIQLGQENKDVTKGRIQEKVRTAMKRTKSGKAGGSDVKAWRCLVVLDQIFNGERMPEQ